jgi:PPM family protein phosphatase
MKLAYRARSDSGPVRTLNEDCYAVGDKPADAPPGQIFVVCDGRGGPHVGDVAAQQAAEMIIATYDAADEPDPGRALTMAFQTTNQRMYQRWGHSSTWVTAVAALALADQLYIANVGDCRAYYFHNRQLEQITIDHTFYAALIDEGMLTRKDVQMYTSGITRLRALGEEIDLEVDVFQHVLQQDEALLLCTDGLHDYLESKEIEEILATVPWEGAVDRFIGLVTARGGRDNVTAVLIWREEQYEE